MRRPAFSTIHLDNARRGFFELAEFEALVTELPDYLRPPMRFAYLTGWRLTSEVLRLRWTQVDLTAGTVRLEPGTTKNRDGRTFPTRELPELHALLSEQRAFTNALQRQLDAVVPWVFHRNGAEIRDCRTAWRAACKRAAALKGRKGQPS